MSMSPRWAEQAVVFSYWNSQYAKILEIQLTVRLETTSEPFADVSIELLFEPVLPEALQDKLHQRLYNGTHTGLAMAVPQSVHLPGGLAVKVLQLHLSPQEIFSLDEDALGTMLETQMMGIVAGLCSGLLNLR
jgi:hypothetical protein